MILIVSTIVNLNQVPSYLEGKFIMQEKRKHKRIPLHYNLKVSANDTEDHLGYMIDVSEEGFKLLSEKQIPTGSEVVCSVQLPEEIKGYKELSFKAVSCWSAQDVNPDYYASGYRIDEIEPDGETVIALIIHQYGHKV
jgi:hypothetical protein